VKDASAQFFNLALRRWKSEAASQIALSNGDGSANVTYGEISEISQAFDKALKNLQNKIVFILLPHDLPKAIAVTACLDLSVPAVVLSTRTAAAEVLKLTEQLKPSAILTDAFYAPKLFNTSMSQEFVQFKEHKFVVGRPREKQTAIDETIAWFLLTSGTTGSSKAVGLTWQSLEERTFGEIDLFGLKKGDHVLNCLSFAHDLGLNQLLSSLTVGASLQVLSTAFPKEILGHLQKDVCGLVGTPMLWTDILRLKDEALKPHPFAGFITVSGGALPVVALRRLEKLFPKARLLKTYGQTETFRSLVETRPEFFATTCTGQALKGVEIFILDENGRACGISDIGQLVHVGDGLMERYFQDDAGTNAKLTTTASLDLAGPDRPALRTGDFFRVQENGFEFIGRRDDLIKHHDHRLSLTEIQNDIAQFPGVVEACVINVPDANPRSSGQKLLAWVTVQDGRPLSVEELRRHCFETMARFKVPEDFFVIPQMPRTFSNKIDRRKLLETSQGLTEVAK
jgi:acyl-CoA synthetase (AMP-forming)/AMP-acid ligase II